MGGWETTFSFLGPFKRPIFNGEPFSFHCPGRYAVISYTPLKIDMSQKKDHFKTIFHLPTINVQGLCWFLGGVSLVIGFIQRYSPLPWLFGQKSRKMQGFSSCNLIYLQCFSGDPRIKTWWDLVFLVWVFPKIGVPQNGWFMMENSINMDDLGVPLFSETSVCFSGEFSTTRNPHPSSNKSFRSPILEHFTSDHSPKKSIFGSRILNIQTDQPQIPKKTSNVPSHDDEGKLQEIAF